VNQISGTTPTDAPAPAQQDSEPADAAGRQAGFGSRGRARRRSRFLRRARELAYRDLGGLVFNLHRFGQRNDALVLAKLSTLAHIDSELRTLENALQEREPVTVLREAGITACPRCAAIHSSEDRFCPNCGLSMARHVDLPIAGAAVPASSPPATPAPAPASPPVTPEAPRAPSGAPAPPAPPASSAAPPAPAAPSGPAPGTTATPPASPNAMAAGGEESTEILRRGAPGT
jgi:hypothetical protein